MRLLSPILPAVIAGTLACHGAVAGDIVIEGSRVAAEGVPTKGQNCTSNALETDESSSRAVWTVASSSETVYDFGQIDVSADAEITSRSVLILEAEISLAEGSYLEVGLRLADGRYLFANLKENEVLSRTTFEFPVDKMATADEQPFTDESAPLAGLSLMVNSDGTETPGSSEVRIERITITP